MNRARILLADDHTIVAQGLAALLRDELDLVGTVGDGGALVEAAGRLRPDVIVTDIAMPGLDGIAAARLIRERDPGARIVVVSIHQEAGVVARGFAAGVLGFVSKVAAGEELAAAVHAALRGERHISPCAAGPPRG